MKYLSIIVVSLMLSGCFYQDVPVYIIDRASEICEERGGIYEITAYAAALPKVTCADGYRKSVSESPASFL